MSSGRDGSVVLSCWRSCQRGDSMFRGADRDSRRCSLDRALGQPTPLHECHLAASSCRCATGQSRLGDVCSTSPPPTRSGLPQAIVWRLCSMLVAARRSKQTGTWESPGRGLPSGSDWQRWRLGLAALGRWRHSTESRRWSTIRRHRQANRGKNAATLGRHPH
jgi:hypothetical protein